MGLNTNRNLPAFANNTPLTRADIRQLKRRLEGLSNDVANVYEYGGSENLPDRFTMEVWPATVTSANNAKGTPSAQYNVKRAITKYGLTDTDIWKTVDEDFPGIEEDVVATNWGELDKDGNPTSNLVEPHQRIMVLAIWNREDGNQGSQSPATKVYIFYFAPLFKLTVGFDCAGIYEDSHSDILFISFDDNNFEVTYATVPDEPPPGDAMKLRRALIAWRGFTVLGPNYPDTTQACNVQIVIFSNFGAQATMTNVVDPAGMEGWDEYPVYFKVTDGNMQDPCVPCPPAATNYGFANVAGKVFFNPCKYAATITAGMSSYTFGTITLGSGLQIDTTSGSGCATNVTIKAKPCDFLPTITDGSSTTQVGTIHIGDGLTLTQNTSTCPGDVTITTAGFTGTRTIQTNTYWDGASLYKTQVDEVWLKGTLVTSSMPYDTLIVTFADCMGG